MPIENSIQILCLIIKKLKIRVTRQSVITELQKHPEPTSMLAISDLLDRWNIPNAGYHVSLEEILETEVPLPFIASFKKNELAVVTQIGSDRFTISNDRWNNHQLSYTQFHELYQGTILVFQKDAHSGEPDYPIKRRKEIANNIRIPFVVTSLVLILALYQLTTQPNYTLPDLRIILLILLKSLGVVTTVLLLIQSIDKNNPLINSLCGSDENQNCNAILTSAAAKISDELNWSEVGLFYFAGSLLGLIIGNENPSAMILLSLLNLISLPYSLYSIYYQWRIARQWCVLCCTVQAILWLEFIFLSHFISFHVGLIKVEDWIRIIIAMSLPALLWTFVKPHLMNSAQLKFLKPQLYQFKYDKTIFDSLIDNGAKYKLLADENSIIVGNHEGDKVITLVSSPFCKACSKAHQLLHELISSRKDVKLQLVFLLRIRSKEIDSQVLSHFIELKSRYDGTQLEIALNDWYMQKTKNYELWKTSHPLNEVANHNELFGKHKAWCKMADVTATPTLFINGRKLPGSYSPEDLKYIL